tara:strand:- start:8 stop:808 length:801 start_codon:yes stop_codon:yes gene_type:complete
MGYENPADFLTGMMTMHNQKAAPPTAEEIFAEDMRVFLEMECEESESSERCFLDDVESFQEDNRRGPAVKPARAVKRRTPPSASTGKKPKPCSEARAPQQSQISFVNAKQPTKKPLFTSNGMGVATAKVDAARIATTGDKNGKLAKRGGPCVYLWIDVDPDTGQPPNTHVDVKIGANLNGCVGKLRSGGGTFLPPRCSGKLVAEIPSTAGGYTELEKRLHMKYDHCRYKLEGRKEWFRFQNMSAVQTLVGQAWWESRVVAERQLEL